MQYCVRTQYGQLLPLFAALNFRTILDEAPCGSLWDFAAVLCRNAVKQLAFALCQLKIDSIHSQIGPLWS